MVKITSLKDMEIYQDSLKLVKLVFELCKQPPIRRELFLCDQLKRASVSVSANIAEGYGRRTKPDFAHFLSVALGSCNEVLALIDVVSVTTNGTKTDNISEAYTILGRRIYTFRTKLSNLSHN